VLYNVAFGLLVIQVAVCLTLNRKENKQQAYSLYEGKNYPSTGELHSYRKPRDPNNTHVHILIRKDARCYLSIWPIRWLKISTTETLVLLIFTILAQILINFL
jgi:hypothetical protein